MNITNEDFKTIEEALKLLPRGDEFNNLPKEKQETIVNADLVMVNLLKKRKANNERTAKYIASKRVNDKNYARTKERKK